MTASFGVCLLLLLPGKETRPLSLSLLLGEVVVGSWLLAGVGRSFEKVT